MAYATSADVSELWAKELTEEETALVDRRLEQVERMILRRVPDLHEQVASGAIAQEDVVDIEAESVYRAVRNPDGIVQETEGSYSYMKSQAAADNTLRITSEEWTTLGVRVGAMFTIVPNVVMPR
jgi:hypothetical protein